VTHELELLAVEQVLDIPPSAGEKIVDANHVSALLDQALGKMRPEKTSAARD
jgi:hypothetical protein